MKEMFTFFRYFQRDRKWKRRSISLDNFKEIESERDVHFFITFYSTDYKRPIWFLLLFSFFPCLVLAWNKIVTFYQHVFVIFAQLVLFHVFVLFLELISFYIYLFFCYICLILLMFFFLLFRFNFLEVYMVSKILIIIWVLI